MDNNSNNNNRTSNPSSSTTNATSTTRQSHKRTFSESDSSSRTERHLCSFSHLWIINYLSSYIEDSNSTCLQSETFSPVNTPYSNTRWSLKLYPRGLNEKQHANNNIAVFLKYVSGTIPTIKAKAEFSVVSRNNELVMLRSTNFHTFSSGNDWGYSEFLDGNYLNSRRNDLLTDDRLRVYVRVILVDEKETIIGDLFHPILPSSASHQQTSAIPKTQASASSSLASSSSVTSMITPSPSNATTTSSAISSGLFSDEKERFKSIELLSNQIKTLFDDQRFTDVNIHVIPKQENTADDLPKSNRMKRTSMKQQQQQPFCSACHCLTNHEQSVDHHEQSSSVIFKDSESNNSSSSQTRRTTRSTTSLLSRIAQSSSETTHSSASTCSSSSSELCASSSNSKPCLCLCHDQENNIDLQPNYLKYSQIIPIATFRAHKAILIARSSSFANQIRLKNLYGTHHPFKSPPMDFYIDDLEPSTVRAMLIYIYTGRLPTCNDEIHNNLNVVDLFRASVKYDLIELRDLAKATMLDVLKIDNAIEMLEVSDQANDHVLKQHILSFIRSNASAVSKTTNWMNFTKQNPDLIIDAFRSLVTPNLTKQAVNHHHHSTSLTTTSSKHARYD